MQKKADVLIMAAGKGERFGKRKQFLRFGNSTVLQSTVKLFENFSEIRTIIIVYPPDMSENDVIKKGGLKNNVLLIKGGVERQESVMNGLEAVTSEYVLIHDAVRPFCSRSLIERVLDETFRFGAVVPGIKPFDTVKYKEGERYVTLDRNAVYLIQTPQGYTTSSIKEAYHKRNKKTFTDSSAIAEDAGMNVRVIEGERENIKITVPEDLMKDCIGE